MLNEFYLCMKSFVLNYRFPVAEVYLVLVTAHQIVIIHLQPI